MTSSSTKIYCGHLLTPKPPNSDGTFEVTSTPKGAVAVNAKGIITAVGESARVLSAHPGSKSVDFGANLILPGFIDTHVHFPQLDIIGSFGEELLGWLEKYTFPTEAKYSSPRIAEEAAPRFVSELYANGTTTAMIYSSPHKEATRTLFAEADRRGMRAIIGKPSMNRHAPHNLLNEVDRDLFESVDLINEWHGKSGRLYYALTPRFAPSCSETMLKGLGDLKVKFPTVYIQTHIAETRAEVEWVQQLFPRHRNYLNVYDHYGLLGPKTVLGHGIYLDDQEMDRVTESQSTIAHCPTSNLFLGSGTMPMAKLKKHGCALSLGSDVGGGTSLSLWKNMLAAYQLQKMTGNVVHATELFYMATLGGARALGLQDVTGSLDVGKKADFQVLTIDANRLLSRRLEDSLTADDMLFALCAHGDDRLTSQVFVDGAHVYSRR